MIKSLVSSVLIVIALVCCCNAYGACLTGMVQSGSVCVDKYEASLWKITNERCIKDLKKGKPINLDACGAVQLGCWY